MQRCGYPDAAATQWRLGHAPKKIPNEISKGIGVLYILRELGTTLLFPLLDLLCLLSRWHLYNQDIKTYCKENA
jgi:hypothetical protein